MQYVTPNRRLTFNELHGVVSQEAELVITFAVSTSNPTLELFAVRMYWAHTSLPCFSVGVITFIDVLLHLFWPSLPAAINDLVPK
jgi:hypothetical protein